MSVFSKNLMNQNYKERPADGEVIQCSTFQENMEAGGAINEENKDYVYVVGTVHAYFPNLSIEKEFYQACLLSGVDASLLDDVSDEVGLSQVNSNPALSSLLYKGLGKAQNSYLTREIQWVFNNIDSNEIYRLLPSSDDSFTEFVAALGETDQPVILVGELITGGDVVVSHLTPSKSTPLTKMLSSGKSQQKPFADLVEEILSLNGSDGFQPYERGLNYLLYNNTHIYSASYSLCYEANSSGPNPNGYQLVNVEPIAYWSGQRLIAKVIFHYQGINTGAVQSWYSAADVTGEYPFMLTEWKRFLPFK